MLLRLWWMIITARILVRILYQNIDILLIQFQVFDPKQYTIDTGTFTIESIAMAPKLPPRSRAITAPV